MKYGTEIVVFLIVFLIAAILYSFYILIRKENPVRYNFAPFPDVAPENLPNANVSQTKLCKQSILPCPSGTDIECEKACGADFVCTTVNKGENVHYNGMKVQPGQWCLPSGKHELGCGTYTGRAVWSSGPDCGEKEQCWQCVCLYPSLFGDPETGCTTQRACIDTTTDEKDPTQADGNYLVGTVGGKEVKWDPTDSEWMPPDGLTPYALQKDNKTPVFSCTCKHNDSNQYGIKYTPLPNDPYNCHAEPCDFEHVARYWDPTTQECNCPGGGQSIKSPVDGMCRGATTCKPGTWDPVAKRCTGDGVSELCNSIVYPRSGESDCVDNCNPAGSTINNNCNEENLCESGGTCVYTPDGKIHTDYGCACPKGTTGSTCGSAAGCIVDGTVYQYNGKNCENKCVKNAIIGSGSYDGSKGCQWSYYKGYDGGSCCSGQCISKSSCEPWSGGHIYCVPCSSTEEEKKTLMAEIYNNAS